jgi:pentatricopeptide repeat domain-containing protein 1
MERQGVMPNVITYNALISACEKGKQPERALEVFEAMQRQGVVPGVITYSALISACGKGKQPAWALEVFEAMQRQGVVPNVITCGALISACEKGKQPERALELFEAYFEEMRLQHVATGGISFSRCVDAQLMSWRSAGVITAIRNIPLALHRRNRDSPWTEYWPRKLICTRATFSWYKEALPF